MKHVVILFTLLSGLAFSQPTGKPAALADGSNITSPSTWKTNLSFLQAADVSSIYAPLNNPTFTGTVSGITKNMVGLGNVDNTSDANKPVSTATQTALGGKAGDGFYRSPITSLAFMGDSITSANAALNSQPEYFTHQDFLRFFAQKEIPFITNGNTKSFGVSGGTSSNWLSVQVPNITALGTKPSHVIVMIGTNDIGSTGNMLPIATSISNLGAGTTALRAAGVEPIFCIYPGSVGAYEKTSHNEELANAIVSWGASNGVYVFDARAQMNDSDIVGSDTSGGLYDNLHPGVNWYFKYGKLLAAKLAPALTALPSPFSYSSPINANPYHSSNMGTVYPPAGEYSTSSVTYSNRPDGVTGRWARLQMVYSPTRTMTLGSGNGAVTYAAVAPWTNKQIFIDTQYIGASTSLDVSVWPQTNVVHIRVKLKVSGGASTATEVAAAVNAAASAYVTATAGGTGASPALSGHIPTRWGVSLIANPASHEAGIVENGKVRFLVEVRVLSGELSSVGLSSSCYTNPANTFVGSFYSCTLPASSGVNTIARGGAFVLMTEWESVGSNGSGGPLYGRFGAFLDIGGRDCVVEIGRVFVQHKP